MKEQLKGIGKDALGAARTGIEVFFLVVAVGVAWKLGTRTLNKIEEKLNKKEK